MEELGWVLWESSRLRCNGLDPILVFGFTNFRSAWEDGRRYQCFDGMEELGWVLWESSGNCDLNTVLAGG